MANVSLDVVNTDDRQKNAHPNTEGHFAKVDAGIQKGSRIGCFRSVTKMQPTNYDMLLFRTLNPLLGAAGHNSDVYAADFRDELMPIRGWWLKHVPWAKHQLRSTLDNRFAVPGCINFIDARTKWFDQHVQQALAGGVIEQVVQLAAGYDTRAYRFGSSLKFFELDLPHASKLKQELVAKCKILEKAQVPAPVYVGADLSQVALDQALAGTGFDSTKPTLFTIEGLIYYLPQQAAVDLMAACCNLAAPGSKVVFDFMHAAALEGKGSSPQGWKYAGFKTTAQAVVNKGEAYKFGIHDTPESVAAYLATASTYAAGTAGEHSKPGVLRLSQYLGPKEMIATQLPHLQWNDKVPPIASFYSYAAAEKIVTPESSKA